MLTLTIHATDALRYALKWNEPKLVSRLLERPDMDDSVPDFNGQTRLFWAIQYKRVDIVKLLLQRQEVNPDTPDRNAFTPSQVVVCVRSLPPVELLLQLEEANARRTDAGNSSALHIAAARGEPEIGTLLYTGLFEVAIKYHPSLAPIYDDDDENNDDDEGDDDSYTLDEPPGYREKSLNSIKRLLARQEGNTGGHDQGGLTPFTLRLLYSRLRICGALTSTLRR
ncbi:ankyrin repeat domain-containing protein [Fusarium circinatum]|uniref:Ankyrin repeat domain-containing protein n=1 Tax=Fusarium circinatum TaxID=48490 RepID=A0A8H5T6L1_FUSCI|nr:ankyrin repeat domain-containing protein [Fusarium circinatum]